MKPRQPARKLLLPFWAWTLLALGIALLIFLATLAQGPDRDLHFSREIPSPLDRHEIGARISSLKSWPGWHFQTTDAEPVNALGEPLQPGYAPEKLVAGEYLLLSIDPRRAPSSKFWIKLRVLEYIPDRLMRIQVLGDRKKRLDTLFDHLEWTIELIPRKSGGTLVRGEALAHTSHWRSRLFGVLTERILMNQAFYPNLIELAGLGESKANLNLTPSDSP